MEVRVRLVVEVWLHRAKLAMEEKVSVRLVEEVMPARVRLVVEMVEMKVRLVVPDSVEVMGSVKFLTDLNRCSPCQRKSSVRRKLMQKAVRQHHVC